MCVCVCVSACVRARAGVCLHVLACVCICAFGCCFVGANGCIPLTMLVDVCQCCCLLMFVCLPLLRHFPCCKTWWIKNLNLNNVDLESVKTKLPGCIVQGLQLGPTEASRYWIYWVPAQYVDAIKDAILGKWQFFWCRCSPLGLLTCPWVAMVIVCWTSLQAGSTIRKPERALRVLNVIASFLLWWPRLSVRLRNAKIHEMWGTLRTGTYFPSVLCVFVFIVFVLWHSVLQLSSVLVHGGFCTE